MENQLIHRMKVNGDMAVLDVNSGAVHLIDEMVYDVLGVFDGKNDEETVSTLKNKYDESELVEVLGELHELMEEGLLFSPEFDVPETFSTEPVLKSLCLHVAHDCNLRCKYCFAGTGDFGGKRELMSAETGRKAIDFAITGSRKRRNLEIDLFGGEPLVNFSVVKEI
ncbi:MAG: 4Fe-4S cluster-binding domain-containing protein, partial [Acidaminococcaceae bacterium]|nr:4Fe-4S cluster-binding domain-containing protein [Acidaminococcaceae bacterium]